MDESELDTWRDLDAIPRAHRIFLANYEELARKLAVLDDPARWLPIRSEGSELFVPFLQEVERLLHNFLAAAYTLSSTIFKVADRRWKKGTQQRRRYEQESPYLRQGVTAFVYGLRTLAQHDTVPLTSAHSSAHRLPDSTFTWEESIRLDRSALLRFDWERSQAGRQYLEEFGDDPDLRSTIEDFKGAVIPFTGWLYDQISGDVARLPSQQRQAAAAWRASIQ